MGLLRAALLVDGSRYAAACLAANWAREARLPVVADLDKLYPTIDSLLPGSIT